MNDGFALIIGGAGFIGRHLIRRLARQNSHRKIVSIDIRAPTEQLDIVEYITLDARLEIPSHVGEPGATIYHLAAVRDYPGHPTADYYETNILSSQRAIDLAERLDAGAILFTSTMSVYGPDEYPKSEISDTGPQNPYGASKWISETLFRGWQARHQSRKLVICRPAVIFGEGDNGNYTRLAHALRGGYFVYVGRRDTIKSAGYVGDLVSSFLFALGHKDRCICYNFAYPRPYQLHEIVNAICEVGGYRKPTTTLPISVLNAAAIPFEVLNSIGLKNPVSRDRIRKLYQSTYIVPAWLESQNFHFDTTLITALTEWRAAPPRGQFL